MIKHNIITPEDMQREQMNSRIIQVTNLEVYLTYYMILLNIANELGIISEQRINSIHRLIQHVIVDDADNRMVVIANMFYVMCTYLQTMPLYDAFELLQGIVDFRTARELLRKSQTFWKTELLKQRSFLNSVSKKVKELDDERITMQFNEFNRAITVVTAATTNGAVNFKELHKTASNFVSSYVSIKETKETNVLTKLKAEIINYITEIQILSRFDTKQFIQQVNEEIRKLEKHQEKQLADLEKEEKKRIHAAKKLFNDQKVDRIAELQDSGLTFTEIVQILDGEWDHIQQEIEKKISEKEEAIQNCFVVPNNDCTLYNILVKYAIYSLAKKEKLVYPETFQEMELLGEQLAMKVVVGEVLGEAKEFGFTDTEIRYLQSLA